MCRPGRRCFQILLTFAVLCSFSKFASAEEPTLNRQSLPDLLARVSRSIVLIQTGGTRVDFRRLPERREQERQAAGTGFVIDNQGHILTNDHVVLPYPEWPNPVIQVTLYDGRVAAAKLVGRDQQSDLAVIQITDHSLPPLKFADSKTVKVGQDAVAIGFALPYELEGMPSVTRGVLSAFHRSRTEARGSEIVSLANLIQTDAAINHGNSGGPLLNHAGDVVGINTLTELKSQGIHFAVSGRLARPVSDMLISTGNVGRAVLGVEAATLPGATADWESRAGFALSEGAFVLSVVSDTPAAHVGLKEFDVIEKLGEYTIRTVGDLNNALVWLRPGQTVSLKFRRYPEGKFDPTHLSAERRSSGQDMTVDVQLAR
jgi:S1-C subfamily serine protease